MERQLGEGWQHQAREQGAMGEDQRERRWWDEVKEKKPFICMSCCIMVPRHFAALLTPANILLTDSSVFNIRQHPAPSPPPSLYLSIVFNKVSEFLSQNNLCDPNQSLSIFKIKLKTLLFFADTSLYDGLKREKRKKENKKKKNLLLCKCCINSQMYVPLDKIVC